MKWMRWLVGPAALVFAGVCIHAQDVPGGWKVLKDKKGTCQMAVPPDWTSNSLIPSSAASPDSKSSAVVHGADPSTSFADAKAAVKNILKPTKIFEESDKRLWYVYEGTGSGTGIINWYAAVPGKPVCTMQVNFKGPVTEDIAKKIVMSVAPAK